LDSCNVPNKFLGTESFRVTDNSEVIAYSSSTSSLDSGTESAVKRMSWCRESLTPRFNHIAKVLEGGDYPPPLPNPNVPVI